MTRARLRDLDIAIGALPTGTHNAITDVPGVTVGHATVITDEPSVVRTGITVVLPRGEKTHLDYTFAGYHTLNGCGEMTGLLWVEESGLLMSPIALTNTAQVGSVRDALVRYGGDRFGGAGFWLPVVAETYDGWLSDMQAFALTEEHLYAAMDTAAVGPVAEGNVGGGTGMICHDFKGGIGTSSRLVETSSGRYTVGALVQSNYGTRADLRVDGVPVGVEITTDEVPTPWRTPPFSSSIIVVLATDAPLLPNQCRALAQRATVGLARTGGSGHIFSGDIFLAFSTGNHYRREARGLIDADMFPMGQLNGLYDAAADAVSEAILNALCAAETMTGQEGRTVYALPLDRLRQVMAAYRPVR
ncbi:MAG: DmpA family aminopeptidase [Anaerolineae bacterium]